MTPTTPIPETRYAPGEAGYVGFQVFGGGSITLLLMGNWLQNLDVMWEEPTLARYLRRLESFARVICFDKRGSGVSDPVPLAALPTIEQWMDDAIVVMDAAGIDEVAVIGDTEGAPMAITFAASFPERVKSLVVVNGFARWRRDDDYPIGMPDDTYERLIERYEQHWGVTSELLDLTAPSVVSSPRFRSWFLRYQRLSMPRGAATAMYRWVTNLDVRAVLPSIRVPTLILHRTGNRHHRVDYGRYLAERIPDARYVELPGADSFPMQAGDTAPLLDEIEEFLTGARPDRGLDRMLATVLFTDIVGSTGIAADRGDAAWLSLLARHDETVRALLHRHHGREVNSTGDGFVAVFDGPARAVTCARRIVDEMDEIGISVRAGLHTGEIELVGDQIAGIAVHVAARVMGVASDGGVVVTSTVKDLVLGSRIDFESLGSRTLRGVPGSWDLYTVGAVP